MIILKIDTNDNALLAPKKEFILKTLLAIWALCLVFLFSAAQVQADAMVVTRAMKSSTIAEIFIEDDQVRLELEVGQVDLDAFHDLLPDETLRKLEIKAPSLTERLPKFFTKGLTIRADEGQPLTGKIQTMAWQPRINRDEITGEPIASTDSEGVLAVTILYPLETQPSTLTFSPPHDDRGFPTSNIGFVVYHQSIPANDFRHLSGNPVIDLDWEDPWYSKFRHKNLWRQYNEPMNAFLYVEPFEVRVEVIARPKDLQQWLDLGVAGQKTLPVEIQEELKQKAGAFLSEHAHLKVDGEDVSPTLDRIHFLRRSLRASIVVDPAEELDMDGAVLGAIFVYRTTGLPKEASLTWDLFPPKHPGVRAAATDEAGPLPYTLLPDDNVLVWKNFLKNPTIPTLVEIDLPAGKALWSIPVVSILCLVLFVPVMIMAMRRRQPAPCIAAVVLLALAFMARPYALVSMASPMDEPVTLSDEDGEKVIGLLLRNVYVAFDFREEAKIYDTLARSAHGDLLTSIYLDTRKSLELQNQGGARVKVKQVELVEMTPEESSDTDGFVAKCKWNVRGSVGHWGHIHQRTNQYEARIHVEVVDGEWKITDLELLQEERVL